MLQRTTGWSIRPVAGLMHPRHFLAGLAFRWVRGRGQVVGPVRGTGFWPLET